MFCWISSLLVVLQTLLLIMGDGENYDKVEEQTYSYYSSGSLQEAKNEQSGEWHFEYDKDGQLTEKYKGSGKWWDTTRRRLDMNGKILEEEYNRNAPYSEQIRIPFLFQGQYYDHETELAYNRFRYYSPELGRYISEDPIRFNSGTLALHSYVEDVNSWVDRYLWTSKISL